MKLIIIGTLSMICSGIWVGCKASKEKNTAIKEVIKIGNGGGFAGKEINYSIFEDGTIKGTGESYKKIKKTAVTQLVSNISVLGIDKLEYNSPGNIYNYIEFLQEGEFKRIAWDPMSKDVPTALVLYYNNINQMIKNSLK